ncbi:LysR substrate-binding domain-containing protein [Vibrio paucivorans]|uniref:LysR substrate-binding domain-containing protein n=1 Tax=Vibrio paucivorans TaxID=2829489 RepID=A0A9X3HSR5_9VIBR|nr:LysR substrate-binding domain-containing protein [Vibrio paucivorans]MCW8335215.1 LysR substrate-binding domain-containing protein [Vibrio paucivorans]
MIRSTLATSLSTFRVASQYASLTEAAKKMHLTTGAVSQQLLQLETLLCFSVFERHSRGIRLTPQGEVLANAVNQHFADIEAVIQSLQQPSGQSKEVKLKLTPSLAFKWLVPKLEQFHRHHPDIQVVTFAETAIVDGGEKDYDLAIDYGCFPYRSDNAELLFEESLLPVMSAAYWEQYSGIERQDDVELSEALWSDATLLHDAMPWQNAPRDYEWQYWFGKHGLALETNRGHFFNRTDMAMSAAEAGVGIALARSLLITNELEKGKLVSPFPSIPANAGYFLLTRTQNDSTRSFTEWLKLQFDLV